MLRKTPREEEQEDEVKEEEIEPVTVMGRVKYFEKQANRRKRKR